jgi:hypothetical protein
MQLCEINVHCPIRYNRELSLAIPKSRELVLNDPGINDVKKVSLFVS